MTSSAGSALSGQRLFCVVLCFFSCFSFLLVVSSVLFLRSCLTLCLVCVFSFVEIYPIVFHLSQIPPSSSAASSPRFETPVLVARQRSTLKKLKREKEKKKRSKKKKEEDSRFQFAFSRNCQSCIHTIRMQRARALTPFTPTFVQIKHYSCFGPRVRQTEFSTRTYISIWPVNDCHFRRQEREKRKEKDQTPRASASLSHAALWWQGKHTRMKLCQVLSSWLI